MSELDANYAKAYGQRAGFGKRPALLLVDFVQAYFDPSCDLYADVEDTLASALRVREEALPSAVPVAPPEVVAQDVVARVPREAHDSRKAVAEPTRAVVLPAFLMVFRDGWEMRLQEHGRAAQW